MTGKERMMTALTGGKPDRLPITVHQFQQAELDRHFGGADQVEAYRMCGLDLSTCVYDMLVPVDSPDWRVAVDDLGFEGREHYTRTRAWTPDGELTWVNARNENTSFRTEHPCKTQRDAEVFASHYPGHSIDRERLRYWVDKTGDDGIVRGFYTFFSQSGPWQDLCEMAGTQEAILWAIDEPDFVHHILELLTGSRLRHIYEELQGLPLDVVECGGGAASANVISPAMFQEFVVPYEQRLNQALRDVGLLSVYHTCGWMLPLLELIPLTGTDASETLSPPGVGGDVGREDRQRVKAVLGSKVALIGGIDQHGLLERGTPADITEDVQHCFQTFGQGGGYICSASDHFFDAPPENLRAMALAALNCSY